MAESIRRDTDDMIVRELADELYREYDFGSRVYRINGPVRFYQRKGGSTHRVVDAAGVVHCVPAPGFYGCVLRWQTRPGLPEVAF